MKIIRFVIWMLVSFAVPAFATVTVTSPTPGSTVSSPVQYTASATASTCSKGVGSVGIYVNNKQVYSSGGAAYINTQLSLSAGSQHTVVQEWDKCGGSSYTTVNITVQAASAPTVALAANPTSIASGSSSILTATATNATQVIVTGTDGSTYTLQPNGGTQSVTPTATTTYTATATGAGGKTSAATTVTVTPNPAPTVSIIANPNSVAAGNSSILTVTAMNATLVTLTGSDGSKYTLQASGGTQAVSPASSTTYTATATGPGGTISANASLTVTPNPAPTVIFSASPASITTGNSSTLTVSTTNATQVIITGSDNSSYTLPTPNGTESVSPTSTTTYTATATGAGGKTSANAIVTVVSNPTPTVSVTANPTSIASGSSSTLTVAATNANQVTVSGTDGSTYSLQPSGGTQSVSPTATTTFTATATGDGGTISASTTVAVVPPGSIQSINHVVFMLQENHSFDNYFGMLNPYRVANGWNIGDDGNTYTVDGIDDKLTSISNKDDEGDVYKLFKFKTTCIDDDSSAWLASYGDVKSYDRSATRPIAMDGFVHNAEGFAKACVRNANCSGAFTDVTGQRAMGYYDQGLLNYYYYMASQFAVSDRWFSPVSSKSISNRIATFTGGTTQGLVADPGSNDHLNSLNIPTIFQELNAAKVSWKIYYTSTDGYCLAGGTCSKGGKTGDYPATYFTHFTYAYQYLHGNTTGTCTAPTVPSSAVGDTTNSFCIDPVHIAPLTTYYTDLTNGTLPSFAFIEAGAGLNDEHPGSGTSILTGQTEVAKVVNAFMSSPEWKDSIFFFSYDEGGGPYEHVPPVPGHSNDFTDASLGTIPDISSIAVNADSYKPCVPPTAGTATLHCDLATTDPGANPTDAAAEQGFAAQLGFRVPNFVVSPFARKHYVSHIPMDHTAIIKFVENRFIGPSAHLTARDAAQPDLLDFFDFTAVPWASPPAPPAPANPTGTCTPTSMGP
jgi:phospholipase C